MKLNKVLIVDDQIDQLKALVSLFEKHYPDYIVYQANNGKTAIKVAEDTAPDIILTDWDMPEMDGIELLKELKKRKFCQNTPILLITGVKMEPKDLRTALESGAMDYITKPINQVELMARMNSAISLSLKNKELQKENDSKINKHLLFINEVNKLLRNLADRLIEIENDDNKGKPINNKILAIIDELENRTNGRGWQYSSRDFNNLSPEFTRKLLSKHPTLTPNEIDVCKMINLGLSNKALASIMCVTPESMRVTRSRLRKKLGLNSEENLQSYLLAI